MLYLTIIIYISAISDEIVLAKRNRSSTLFHFFPLEGGYE